MDKMRQEMWNRAIDRLGQEAREDAANGKLWEPLLLMKKVEQENLIFGSSYTGKVTKC